MRQSSFWLLHWGEVTCRTGLPETSLGMAPSRTQGPEVSRAPGLDSMTPSAWSTKARRATNWGFTTFQGIRLDCFEVEFNTPP